MLKTNSRGINQYPRINFEVPEKIKDAIVKKCRIEGTTQRMVGLLLFKEWLSLPAVPEEKINGN